MRTLVAGVALAAVALGGAGCGGSSGADSVGAPGVTDEPCPNAVNKGHGCIYLGIISDLSSPAFKALGVPMTKAVQAFWQRVNKQGGIGGYDVDAVTHVRDSKYDPQLHRQAYQDLKGKVLALAQTLGSSTTDSILGDLRGSKTVAVPVSWTSKWESEDVVLESGTSYCYESMNAVDYAVQTFKAKKVMAVHYAGEYGGDAAAGAKIAAKAHGLGYSALETGQGTRNQKDAVDAVVREKPDLVILTTNTADAGAVVGESVARGFSGRFVGTSPTWDKGLLTGSAEQAVKSHYLQSAPWKPFATDSPGHRAMRAALGEVEPNDAYTSGWTASYPLKAVLRKAAEDEKLTREGVFEAVKETAFVDYEGMLPKAAGNFSGDPNSSAFRQTVFGRPDDREFTGIKVISDFYTGSTARAHRLTSPCFTSG